MSSPKYRMSFTTGGLFVAQSALLAELYLDLADWKHVRTRAIDENLLQTRTVRSAKLISGEICFRLGELDEQELIEESGFVKHIRFKEPVCIMMDGKKRISIILKHACKLKN